MPRSDMEDLPRRIYFFWMQGRDAAPELAQFAWAQWARLNPDFEIVVLDLEEARALLHHLPVDVGAIAPAALSDILRIELLASRGGIWCDSSVLPCRRLADWLPAEMEGADFFGFRWNMRIRPLASWFLAARGGSIVARKWREAVTAYWQVAREPNPAHALPNALTIDAFRAMGFDGGVEEAAYPYFWFHHMLGNLVETDPDVRQVWHRMSTLEAVHAQRLDAWMSADSAPPASFRGVVRRLASPVGYRDMKLRSLLGGSAVHKLSFRRTYRDATWRALRRHISEKAQAA